MVEDRLSNWETNKIKELKNYYLLNTLSIFKMLNRKKDYLKIKNNVILIYFEPLNLTFLIENKIIKAILPRKKAKDLLGLINKNIYQIKSEKYSHLKKELVECYEQCI